MRIRVFISICLMSMNAAAQDFVKLEQIIASTWLPHDVTCKWEPMFGDPAVLNSLKNIEVIGSLDDFANGLLSITFKGTDNQGREQRIILKGRARIFGQAYSVAERVKASGEVKSENITQVNCEWSNLRAATLLDRNAIAGKFAVRPLVPGRPILANDLRSRPLIRSGDSVTVICERGGVTVKVEGTAMRDGGEGETIPVRVPELEQNRLEGVVQNDATILWIP